MKYKNKWYDNEQLLRMWHIDKGMRVSEIAAYAGVSTETIRLLLNKYNIKKGK